MEGKSQEASRNVPTQRVAGGSETLPQGTSRPETTPASTPLQVGESGGQATVTLSMELFQKIMQSAPPGIDLALLLAQAGVVSTPPPIVGLQEQGTHGGEPAGPEAETTGRVAEIQEPRRAGQTETDPNSTVTAGPSITDADVSKANSDVVGCDSRDEVSRPERITDLTLRSEGMENPTKEAVGNAEPTSTEREVIYLAEEGERTKRTNPVDQSARARAATIHIYRRRPAREEASAKQLIVEQPKEASENEAEGNVDKPAGSAADPPRRRRRVLIAEEHEEEDEDVVFTLINTLPSFGQTDPPAEMVESDRERKERKRKGKAIAAPVKKKSRQASSTLVIQEGRQRTEEEDDEEEEALRRERRSKRQNDGRRRIPEQRQELARVQFEKMKVRLDNDLLGRMVEFDNPQTTEECRERIGNSKQLRSGRRLDQEVLESLEALGEFMELITGVGFDWLLVPSSPRMPTELAQEFFTSFHFTLSTDVGAESIRFRLFNRVMRMSIREWSVRLGLYTADQEAEWFARDIGTPKEIPEFNDQAN